MTGLITPELEKESRKAGRISSNEPNVTKGIGEYKVVPRVNIVLGK